jgi:hypothetical protein
MNSEIISKLAKLVEPQVCASLIAKGYATLEESDDKLIFENLVIEKSIIKKLGITESSFYEDSEFLNELLNTFPSGEYRCSKNVLKSRIRNFMKKTSFPDITPDEILTAARTWITRKETPYHGHIINFIFKYDNKVYTSRLETIVEELRHDKLNTPNIVNISSTSNLDDL